MSATFNWSGTYGDSGSPTTTDLGSSGNLVNFKDSDDLSDPTDYTSNPITAGNNSYEVWLRAHLTGTFNQVQNVRFYKSDGSLGTGESIKWTGEQETYVTPVKTDSTVATSDIPTTEPGSANVSIGGDLSGSLSAAGYTDYIVLQLQTTASAESGDTETFTITILYDEN